MVVPIDFAGWEVEPPYPDGDPDGGFTLEPEDTLAGLIADYVSECQRSRDAVAGHGLDETARGEGMTFMLRYAFLIKTRAVDRAV